MISAALGAVGGAITRGANQVSAREAAADVTRFSKRRKQNRKRAFGARLTAILSGALTTVLIGLKGNELFAHAESYLTALALLMSATATLVSSWESFFDHRWLWIRYTVTLTKLYAISDDLEYACAGGQTVPESELDMLHSRRHEVLQEMTTTWTDKRLGEEVAHGDKVRR